MRAVGPLRAFLGAVTADAVALEARKAADAAVDQAYRMLRLPTSRAQFAELAEAAVRGQMSYRGFLGVCSGVHAP